MASQLSLDTQNNTTEELIAEPRLWTAGLVNAVEDWRGGTLRARVWTLKIGRRIEMEGQLSLPKAA